MGLAAKNVGLIYWTRLIDNTLSYRPVAVNGQIPKVSLYGPVASTGHIPSLTLDRSSKYHCFYTAHTSVHHRLRIMSMVNKTQMSFRIYFSSISKCELPKMLILVEI